MLLAAESAGRRELLLELLRARGIQPKIFDDFAAFVASDLKLGVTVSAAVSGLRLETPPLEILTESLLFGDRARQERRRRRAERDPAKILKELSDLRVGAPVVHEAYGVGRYVGLQTMDVAGYTGEFLVLEYADGDKLYVPVQALHLVSRYTGAPADTAPLHKLGGAEWQKARRKAAQRIRDVAAELLDLYSRRAAREGTSMAAPRSRLSRLRGRLSLRGDRRSGRGHRPGARRHEVGQAHGPGDLRRRGLRQDGSCAARGLRRRDRRQAGGGARADDAARPAASTRPSSTASPTGRCASRACRAFAPPRRRRGDRGHRATARWISSSPHTGCCRARCASRISVSSSSTRSTASACATRRSSRRCAPRCDVLTLTATPIPRTLNMAMGGLRDLSLITTPPAERLAVKTFVLEWNETVVREALRREIRRGGQIYFVHNTIETIEKTAQAVRKLVPEATVARRPWTDARARSRAAHARLLSPPIQRPGVHHHHRERHRRADREHHHHRSRRPLRPRADSSAARPRRTLAPPRLRLPHHPAPQGHDGRRGQAARGAGITRGARCRIHPRHPRSGDPRRRRAARR